MAESMRTQRKKRGGRPTTTGVVGQKSTLSIRASAALKNELDRAAKQNGRSLSQEAEFRLETSFHSQAQASEGLRLAFGPELAAFILIIARTTRNVGAAFDLFAGSGAGDPSAWAYSALAFDEAIKALKHIGKALRPE